MRTERYPTEQDMITIHTSLCRAFSPSTKYLMPWTVDSWIILRVRVPSDQRLPSALTWRYFLKLCKFIVFTINSQLVISTSWTPTYRSNKCGPSDIKDSWCCCVWGLTLISNKLINSIEKLSVFPLFSHERWLKIKKKWTKRKFAIFLGYFCDMTFTYYICKVL